MHICPICHTNLCTRHFDIWWNPNKFNPNDYWKLPRYCSKFFRIWWNPEKYNVKDINYLEEYCNEFKDEWMILKVYYSILL